MFVDFVVLFLGWMKCGMKMNSEDFEYFGSFRVKLLNKLLLVYIYIFFFSPVQPCSG